jgi:hypothetical protein
MVQTVGNIGIDAATLGSLIVPGELGDSITEALVRGKEEGWEALMKALSSDQRNHMIEMERKFQEVVTTPLYQSRKEKYQKGGDGETLASVKAWLMGGADTVEYLIENPSRLVDVSIESLPYMVGAGMASRMATKGMRKRVADLASGSKLQGRALAKAQDKFAKAITKRGVYASVGFTGVTEGMSNATSAYQKVLGLDEAELADSERYQSLMSQEGMTHDKAIGIMARDAAFTTFAATGVLAMIANRVTGAAKLEAGLFQRLDKVGPKGIIGQAARVVKPGASEGVEEVIQSGGGETVTQAVTGAVTDTKQLDGAQSTSSRVRRLRAEVSTKS